MGLLVLLLCVPCATAVMGLLVLLLCVPCATAVIIILIHVNRVSGFSALPMPKSAIGHAHAHLYGA